MPNKSDGKGLGRLYRALYDSLCGAAPHERPWHFQWLSTIYLRRRLAELLPGMGGRVLDVGCGNKPYRDLFGEITEYTGIDVVPGPAVDITVRPDEPWPLPDGHFDVLLSTQVIEHSEDLDLTLGQMSRVLKVGGTAVLSFPFLYNVHGAPYDYRRFTHFAAQRLFKNNYETLHCEVQGGIGSTLVVLWLNWIETALSRNLFTRLMKGVLMPVFIAVSFVCNLVGLLLDRLDRTESFYSNILLVVRKVSP